MSLRRGTWRAIAAVAFFAAAGCSLVLGELTDTNCESDVDCAGIPSTKCDPASKLCVAAAVTTTPTGEGGPVADECATNQDCSQKIGGEPAVCVRDGVTPVHCAPLNLGEDCKLEPGFDQWTDDGAVVFAHFDRLSDSNYPRLWVNASAMAFQEVNQWGPGLPEIASGARRRPVVFIACDLKTATLEAAVAHVAKAGVTAVIGPGDSQSMIQLSTYTIPKGIFLMGTSASSPALSKLDDNGLVWRVASSSAYEATAANKYITDLEAETRAALSMPPGNNIKILELYVGNEAGEGLRVNFLDKLSFNAGRSDSTTTTDLIEKRYNDPHAGAVNFATLVTEVAAAAPNIIVLLDEGHGLEADLPFRIEQAWTGPNRPIYLFMSEAAKIYDGSDVTNLILRIPSVVPRLRFAFARDTNKDGDYAKFAQAYQLKYSKSSFTRNTQYSYDAAYFLAYAYYAANPTKAHVSGAEVLEGAKKLLPNGPVTTFTVGPGDLSQIQNVFKTLQSGKAADLAGTTNNLNFDPLLGELPQSQSTITVRCVGKCDGPTTVPPCTAPTGDAGLAQYVVKETGRLYDPSVGLTGTYACP